MKFLTQQKLNHDVYEGDLGVLYLQCNPVECYIQLTVSRFLTGFNSNGLVMLMTKKDAYYINIKRLKITASNVNRNDSPVLILYCESAVQLPLGIKG